MIGAPIGSWFQIQVLYRNASDDTGRFVLWLDGQLVYDLVRPFGLSPTVYFSPSSVSADLAPTDSAIYVDDASVSVAAMSFD